jgi:aspartate/methionine/tyrosine aminotransferase
MHSIDQRFQRLATTYAPGQEVRLAAGATVALPAGEVLAGEPVDFSHGNVDVDAFMPTPSALDEFIAGVNRGGAQAYTDYRGSAAIRARLAGRLAAFTGAAVAADDGLIITAGTQGALFLAGASSIGADDKVAIVDPDYFANRKIVEFLGGQVMPVRLDYLDGGEAAGLDLGQLEDAFKAGAKVFLVSNPNNPTGVVCSAGEIGAIAELANKYGAIVIVDQLYSRLLYPGQTYHHLRASTIDADNVLTIMGPSKTESLSGYRLGVASGAPRLVDRMEKLQAIVSLRAPGYSQAVLNTWFAEPAGWMQRRIDEHRAIRDDLLTVFSTAGDVAVRTPGAGSYLFPGFDGLKMPLHDFVGLLRRAANVTVTPGTEVGPRSVRSIRLNFSQNREAAVRAAGRIVTIFKRHAV